MKPLLLLHSRSDYNTNDIWKAAIKRGWSTDRIHDFDVAQRAEGRDHVRYYGNTLQAERIKDFPFKFYTLNPIVLAETPLSKRHIQYTTLSNLREFNTPYFIKPVYQKFFEARVYKPGEQITQGSLPNDEIYVQEVVDIINEVRCFCLNGKIHTASYYRISKDYMLLNMDEDRPEILDNMVKHLSLYYPPGVVLDFGFTVDRGWIFIEPNEAWASGIYACDPDKCLDVIDASQY